MTDSSLTVLKGIGEKRAELLGQLGIRTVSDLLYYLPRSYRDYSKTVPVSEMQHGDYVAASVRILSDPRTVRVKGMTIVSARATDGVSNVQLSWFNQPYRRGQVSAGEIRTVCGRVSRKKGTTILNPSVYDGLPGLIPEYPLCRGLSQRNIREALKAAVQKPELFPEETLPSEIRTRHGLCALDEAFRMVHFPRDRSELERGRKRLSFENLLSYMLAVEMQRQERTKQNGFAFRTDGILEKYERKIPFALTGAQKRVATEICADMEKPFPMNRLVQGDVGSGKTAVAVFAACVAAANGKQCAILVPTAILAEQHYRVLQPLFGSSACLLTGGMKKNERAETLERLRNGSASVAVGTHALLEQDVHFQDLGLVITDEQHRFGVRQRADMERKGIRPDVIVMSATPIPRTLAMLMYGDLDVSLIDEMPPGRKTIKTSFIAESSRDKMYDYIAEEAGHGNQTYVVCPFIDPPEELEGPSATEVYQELTSRYPGVRIDLLHGRMPQQKKDEVMERFRTGETSVLVTTTVIEVGVHVDDAVIMVLEGADRFGLAQMHQLRGRVGRGSRQAYCFLLSDNRSESVHERFAALVRNSDGFKIAEEDLSQRGPGDFLGTRQHGEGDAELLRATASMEMIVEAKETAQEIIDIPNVTNNAILQNALDRFSRQMDVITMN
ncbi:MAG: ATP-dependent DNA helicase RecG [Clostridia bacterium]|nr:ATP-dependent DNA helicase RecG [Clostridia bacterium]MBR0445232.1 ATP-dependent DNA helicase RecG [Clostridia bacterium]